jgi:hypothetical protein
MKRSQFALLLSGVMLLTSLADSHYGYLTSLLGKGQIPGDAPFWGDNLVLSPTDIETNGGWFT